ncbi:hypothetical protein QJQ45_014431, partial [Haematococcus lacustris]
AANHSHLTRCPTAPPGVPPALQLPHHEAAKALTMFSSASIEQSRARCIAHVDLDAFYTQVEVGRNPALRGRPVGVVQYNPNGDLRTLPPEAPRIFPTTLSSLIAVSYEARARGVKRGMSGSEARRLCPDLVLVQVPVAHSKADLSIYREAGVRVADVLSRLSVCERASIDEVYLDVSEEAARRLAAVPPDQAPPAPPCWRGVHVVGAEAIAPPQLQVGATGGGQGSGVGWGQGSRGGSVSLHPMQPYPSFAFPWLPSRVWPVALRPAGGCSLRQAKGLGRPVRRLTRCQGRRQRPGGGGPLRPGRRMSVCWLRGRPWWLSCGGRWRGSSGSAAAQGWRTTSCWQSWAQACISLPSRQLVPGSAVEGLLRDLPLAKLRGLGGEYGARVSAALGVTTCGQLAAVPVSRLAALFGDRGSWLHRMAHGIDSEADSVTQRLLPKSLGCGKTFRGPAALNTVGAVRHWLLQLGAELAQRLEADRRDHARRPRTLTVHASVQGEGGQLVSVSRSCALPRPEPQAMADALAALVSKWAKDRAGWRIVEMHIGAAGFEAAPTTSITHFMSCSSSTAGGHPPHSPGSREHPGGAGGQQPEARAKAAGGGGGPTQAARPLPGVLTAGVQGGGGTQATPRAPGPWQAVAAQEGGPESALLRAAACSPGPECELRSEPTRSRDPVWALGLAPGSRVDPEVLAALPLDIQAEVRQHIAQRRDQPRSRVVQGGKRARTGVEGGAQQGIRAFFTQP